MRTQDKLKLAQIASPREVRHQDCRPEATKLKRPRPQEPIELSVIGGTKEGLTPWPKGMPPYQIWFVFNA